MITFDNKVYAPRMSFLQKRFNPEVGFWGSMKDMVVSGQEFNQDLLYSKFRRGDLNCKAAIKPTDRKTHLILKSLYAFFQVGLVVRNGDQAALFQRTDLGKRITSKQSVILSLTPNSIFDTPSCISKCATHMGISVRKNQVRPYAIGFNEFSLNRKTPAPAYFWLLFQVNLKEIPKAHKTERMKYLGMKRIESLYTRKTRVDGRAVEFGGAFDETIITAMRNGLDQLSTGDTAFRKLTREERDSLKDVDFKSKDEQVRKRLSALGVGATAGSAIKLVDMARRSEWVAEKSADLDQYIEMLVQLAQNLV